MGFYFIWGPVLFIVAAAYASVGLGGGTAYLSLLSFWNADADTLRPMAWGLNVVVATVGLFNYARQGHLEIKKVWHYLTGGVIGASLGAGIPISDNLFRWLLAVTLVVLALRMIFDKKKESREMEPSRQWSWPAAMALGFVPGVISGLVGIGGGIILGPIVLTLGLLTIKKSAPLTSAYILVCSAGALVVHFSKGGTLPWPQFTTLAAVVMVGGFIGSFYGASKASPRTLSRIFGVIVATAAINLLIKAIRHTF